MCEYTCATRRRRDDKCESAGVVGAIENRRSSILHDSKTAKTKKAKITQKSITKKI